MSLATTVATAIEKVNDLMDLVKGQYNKWDGEVKAKIAELESWKSNIRINKTIDLRNLDFDTFYPVMISGVGVNKKFRVYKSYSSGNTDGNLAGVDIEFLTSGGSWGGNPMVINIIQNKQTYQQNVGAIGYMYFGYRVGLYMRGGFAYGIESNGSFDFEVLETKTIYRHADANGNYELTAGPVSLQDCLDSAGAITTNDAFKSHGTVYINSLGA